MRAGSRVVRMLDTAIGGRPAVPPARRPVVALVAAVAAAGLTAGGAVLSGVHGPVRMDSAVESILPAGGEQVARLGTAAGDAVTVGVSGLVVAAVALGTRKGWRKATTAACGPVAAGVLADRDP